MKINFFVQVSPEEEERRKVRRERNKLAAARCRKRRLDHTNELVGVSTTLYSNIQKKFSFSWRAPKLRDNHSLDNEYAPE